MYEDKTYSVLMNRMLERVSDQVDKREGSIIWDALAPTAMEHEMMYIELESILQEIFGDTASRNFLILHCREMGIKPYAATKAILQGEFTPTTIDVTGQRFNISKTNYIVTEMIEPGIYQVQCETAGVIGNQYLGTMIPVEYIEGLKTAELTELLIPGEEEEDTESLRARRAASTKNPTTSGNQSHYKQWALEVAGVGAAKVFPLWDGVGTVKVVIVDREKKPATQALVTQTWNHIEGQRPIGAEVTVTSGTSKQLDITAKLVLSKGYSLQSVINAYKTALIRFCRDITFTTTYISYAKLGTLLLETEGVLDYSELQLNNGTSNIRLEPEEVPVTGDLKLEV